MAKAKAALDAEGRARMAELVEAALADWAEPPDFTEAERAHLRALDAEPFEPVDPAEVEAFFAADWSGHRPT